MQDYMLSLHNSQICNVAYFLYCFRLSSPHGCIARGGLREVSAPLRHTLAEPWWMSVCFTTQLRAAAGHAVYGRRYGGPYCHWTVSTADIIQGCGTPEPDGRCSGSNEPPESNLPVQGCVLQHYQEFCKF